MLSAHGRFSIFAENDDIRVPIMETVIPTDTVIKIILLDLLDLYLKTYRF